MQHKITTILAIDPALSKLGWVILELQNNKILVIKKGTVEASRTTSKVLYRELNNTYTKRTITLDEIKKQIITLMDLYKPDHIVAEDAFFNHRFASAFAALIQVLTVISQTVYSNYSLPLHKIPTKTAKKELCGYGGNSKQPIQLAIKNNKLIKIDNSIDNMNEHEADAVAVGYAFITKILPILT